MQAQAHDEAIAHSGFAETGTGAVSAFAAEKLPTLEEHRQMIEGSVAN